MSQLASSWLVVTLALLMANLPFISNRLFAFYAVSGPKSLGLRLVEMMAGYFVVGAVSLFLEQRSGQIEPQGWEVYAITGTLFITFACPGFVYRYLFKRRA